MIRDAKGGLFTHLLDWYVGHKVKRAFRGVWLRGALPQNERGLLVYLNHSSFWDGFVVHQLAAAARWNGFAMMEEENLAKYRFHTRIGAFGVKKGDAERGLPTLRYAREVLHRPNAALMVFPEGELRAGQGPLGPLQRGVEVLARIARVRCLPVAVRYAFLEHEYPDVLLEAGPVHEAAPLSHFTQSLEDARARVYAARSTEGFTCLVRGRSSVQQRWDAARRLPPPLAPREGQH